MSVFIVGMFSQVFVNIAIKCGLETESTGLTPQKLDLGHMQPVDLVTMETGELQDVVFYLADTAVTLTSFLTVYPPACKVLHDLQFCPQSVHSHDQSMVKVYIIDFLSASHTHTLTQITQAEIDAFQNGGGTFIEAKCWFTLALLRLEMGEEPARDVCNETKPPFSFYC